MSFGLTEYRTWLKKEMLKHPALENPENRIYESTWIAYTLASEDMANNHYRERLLDRLETWAREWNGRHIREIGPLALIAVLLPEERAEPLIPVIRGVLGTLLEKSDSEWSVLNEPEIIFAICLFLRTHATDMTSKVAPIVRERLKGPLWRQILIRAGLVEIGQDEPSLPSEPPVDERDIIFQLWFAERYLPEQPRVEYWEKFRSIKDGLSFEPDSNLRTLDIVEAALLYEAIGRELQGRDPMGLFRDYPFEPELRKAVETLFASGEYVRAVEEATLKLKDVIKKVSNLEIDDETSLLAKAFAPVDKPIVRFNNLLGTKAGKNEQSGLYLIVKGIYTAFRNPSAHQASDHPLLESDAYDAYDKLIVINYILKRVKRADVT